MQRPRPLGLLHVRAVEAVRSKRFWAAAITAVALPLIFSLLDNRFQWFTNANEALDRWGVPTVITNFLDGVHRLFQPGLSWLCIVLILIAVDIWWRSRKAVDTQLYVLRESKRMGEAVISEDVLKDEVSDHLRALSKWEKRTTRWIKAAFSRSKAREFGDTPVPTGMRVAGTHGDKHEGHVARAVALVGRLTSWYEELEASSR